MFMFIEYLAYNNVFLEPVLEKIYLFTKGYCKTKHGKCGWPKT